MEKRTVHVSIELRTDAPAALLESHFRGGDSGTSVPIFDDTGARFELEVGEVEVNVIRETKPKRAKAAKKKAARRK